MLTPEFLRSKIIETKKEIALLRSIEWNNERREMLNAYEKQLDELEVQVSLIELLMRGR